MFAGTGRDEQNLELPRPPPGNESQWAHQQLLRSSHGVLWRGTVLPLSVREMKRSFTLRLLPPAAGTQQRCLQAFSFGPSGLAANSVAGGSELSMDTVLYRMQSRASLASLGLSWSPLEAVHPV
jgi:hypothetical protein